MSNQTGSWAASQQDGTFVKKKQKKVFLLLLKKKNLWFHVNSRPQWSCKLITVTWKQFFVFFFLLLCLNEW